MKIRALFILFLGFANACTGQNLFLINKKQTARSTQYKYQEGEQVVVGVNGKRRVGVFYIENEHTMRLNDSMIRLEDIEWVMVKRGWAAKVALMGIKWGGTYFFTFAINDWFRTGDPFATPYTARNSLVLMGVGAVALAISLKKCRPDQYHFYLIE